MSPRRNHAAGSHADRRRPQLFAETLGLTLDFDERVEVVGSAANGKEAVRLALELQPDSVLMDLEMPLLDGVGATRLLRRLLPACKVVVLTASLSAEDAHRRAAAGAAAYLTKGVLDRAVVDALLESGALRSAPTCATLRLGPQSCTRSPSP